MTPEKPLIIFGFVATLVNSGPRYARALDEVCHNFGIPSLPEQDVQKMLGEKNLKEIMAALPKPVEHAREEAFIDACNHICDDILKRSDWNEPLYEGAYDVVKTFHAQNYPLAIFTGTREEAVTQELKHHALTPYFAPERIKAKDNDRDGFIDTKVLKSRQLSALKETVPINHPIFVIGDSESDAQAAMQLDLTFIGYAANENKRKRLEAVGVKNIFTHHAELPKMIGSFMAPAMQIYNPSPRP